MALKLNVGISKKIGQPNFGSLGASCHVEVELDPSLIFNDVPALHSRIKQAYTACRQAVHDELTRGQATASEQMSNGQADAPAAGIGSINGTNGQRATQKQIDYAKQLAAQILGLGFRRLETLSDHMFTKPLADLSSLEASKLINTLKAIKVGDVELATALNGAVHDRETEPS